MPSSQVWAMSAETEDSSADVPVRFCISAVVSPPWSNVLVIQWVYICIHLSAKDGVPPPI